VFQTDESIGSNGAAGVRVESVRIEDLEPLYKYEPQHPDAIKEGQWKGYVAYPNVNMMTEYTDAMEAARAYEANLGAIEITKDLANQTLRIIA
jgi:flagellar basal-body rod protein FlgC